MINLEQYRNEIIMPALDTIGHYSVEAEELVLATHLHESQGLSCLVQKGGGPALGFGQMEPITHTDIWYNFIRYHSVLETTIRKLISRGNNTGPIPNCNELIFNPRYAAAMTRIHYFRISAPLPGSDVRDMAAYWKKYYNTPKGKGTEQEFISNYIYYTSLT